MEAVQLLTRPTLGNHRQPAQKIARALGWFTLGLGVTEMVAPRAVANFVGRSWRPSETRLMGLRKVLAGVGTITGAQWTGRSWARVGGNLLELARSRKSKPPVTKMRRSSTAVCAAVAVGALAGAAIINVKRVRAQRDARRAVRHSASTSVNLSPEQCYQYWRDPEKLPTFFKHLKSARDLGDSRAEWVVRGADGKDITWPVEFIEDVPGEVIAWRSTDDSEMTHSGWVRFEPRGTGRGTIVRLHMEYEFPGQLNERMVNQILGYDPGMRLRKALMRFKQLLETGEIATTEGQSAGRPQGVTSLDRMARI